MKKVIVTGAGGFIGRHLVNELCNNDYFVYAVVRERKKQQFSNIKSDRIQEIECDLQEIEFLKMKIAARDISCFFHFAWEGVSGDQLKHERIQQQNMKASIKAIETAYQMGCNRFIGAGSLHEVECMIEMEKGEAVSNFGNYYKMYKLLAHYSCKLKAQELGIEFFWPRLTNTYGAGEQSKRLIHSIISSLLIGKSPDLSTGEQLYNFIYVTDAARAYRMIAEKGIPFSSYTIGSETVKPLKEYLSEIPKIIGVDIPLGFGMHDFSAVFLKSEDLNAKNLFQDTGFRTKVSFREGVLETAKEIREKQIL